MKKRVFSFLLALCMLCVTFTMPAFAAGSEAARPRQGQAAQFVSTWQLVVDQSGRLHAYNKETGKETIAMTGVSMVTITEPSYILALKTDGTLWLMYYDSNYTEEGEWIDSYLTKPIKLMDNVRKAAGNFALCPNGDLYGINLDNLYRGSDEPLRASDAVITKIGTNVADVDDNGYFISGNKLMYGWKDGAKEEMTLPFSDGAELYCGLENFVLTRSGDLWAWGESYYGGVGNGMFYNRLYVWGINVENGWYPAALETNEPTVILSGVKSLWAEDGTAYYAIKKDGSVWKWGDGQPVMAYFNKDSSYLGETRFPKDETGYTPRKVAMPDHWDYNISDYNQTVIRFQNDGSCRAGKWTRDADTNYQPAYSGWKTLSDWANDPGNTTPFTDVRSSQYYYEPVKWAVGKQITDGTSPTTFSPDKTCTRGQIITFLWRAAGSPAPKNDAPFTDVSADAYYAKAAAWAAEQGMAEGSTFAPNAPCTRLMAVEFMWKYAGSPAASKADFTDVDSAAVNWAVKENVTTGTSPTTFSPDKTCTRGQIVTFLYRGFAK